MRPSSISFFPAVPAAVFLRPFSFCFGYRFVSNLIPPVSGFQGRRALLHPRQGLAEYRVPTTRELEDQEIKRTRVWSLDA